MLKMIRPADDVTLDADDVTLDDIRSIHISDERESSSSGKLCVFVASTRIFFTKVLEE